MKDDKEPTKVDNVIRVAFGKTEESADPDAAKKLEAFTRMVDEGMVMLTLDARKDNVAVPDGHKEELQLALNFSHRFGLDDFEFDLKGVRASLSFGGEVFPVDVPWEAVFMIRSHVTDEVVLFKSALPEELTRQRARLFVSVESWPDGDDDEALRAALIERQRRLGAPTGLLGAHVMRGDDGGIVEMSIWIDRPHFEAARADLDAATEAASLAPGTRKGLEEV